MARKEMSERRRRLLLAAVTTVGSITLGGYLANTRLFRETSQLAAGPRGQVNNVPTPDLKGLFEQEKSLTGYIINSSFDIMNKQVPLLGQSNTRSTLESSMFGYLDNQGASSSDVISGLKVAGSVDGRSLGMNMLWQRRQNGQVSTYGVNPLDQERITWAVNNDIDPRMLAIARDSIYPASKLLKAAPELFFEAIPQAKRTQLDIEDTLPNPGLLAKLNMTETGFHNIANQGNLNKHWGYVYVGGGNAWDELNLSPDWYPSGQIDLTWIADRLQQQTALPYSDNVRLFPGSQRGNSLQNGSGGAIGPQFMPIMWRFFSGMYDEANARLGNIYPNPNPFDPFTGTIMSYLFLASEVFARHGSVFNKIETITRPGFRATGAETDKLAALEKWNPLWTEAIGSLWSGYSYYNQFGRV